LNLFTNPAFAQLIQRAPGLDLGTVEHNSMKDLIGKPVFDHCYPALARLVVAGRRLVND
jgi:hypothetical protein